MATSKREYTDNLKRNYYHGKISAMIRDYNDLYDHGLKREADRLSAIVASLSDWARDSR